jgi:single-stranded DNA-binding protein
VACFGAAGEAADRYLARGREVGVTGRLAHREWTGQDGIKRSRHSVIGNVSCGRQVEGEKGTWPSSEPPTPSEPGSPRRTPPGPRRARRWPSRACSTIGAAGLAGVGGNNGGRAHDGETAIRAPVGPIPHPLKPPRMSL